MNVSVAPESTTTVYFPLSDGADKCRWFQSGQVVGYYVGNLVIGFLGLAVWCDLCQLCRLHCVGAGLGGRSLL
jgi:hypothetical protein